MTPDSTIDPQLQSQPHTLPREEPNETRSRDAGSESQSDGEQEIGTTRKRQKLNLYKCDQCRIARKKCFPTDRRWPGQKCERCTNHKPEELPCSEPRLNTRKRGPNKSAAQSKKLQVEKPEPVRSNEPSDEEETRSIDSAPRYDRPLRIAVPKRIKREHDQALTLTETEAKTNSSKEQLLPEVYHKLPPNSFRLVRVKPGRKDEDVVCSFQTVSFDDDVAYEAISYYWGGNDPGGAVVNVWLEDSQKKRYPKDIMSSNLRNALKSLRSPTEPRNFWIDALCIYRQDPTEKHVQVNNKPRIFHKASNQCFWLGDDETCRFGMNFITKILELDNIDNLVRDPESIEGWSGFASLLKNVAFTRLWMVQEVTMAPNTTLHCGPQAIQYTDFVDAAAIFVSSQDDLIRLFQQHGHKYGKNYMELMDRKISVTKRFIDVTQNSSRRLRGNESKTERCFNLEYLVSFLGDLTCGDQRDRIYSVLTLANDGLPPPDGSCIEHTLALNNNHKLKIDYDRDLVDVYQDFVIHAITVSKSLDIICRGWAAAVPVRETELPTWIRPLQSPLQPPFDANSSERTNGDSLVGLSYHRRYAASRNIPFVIKPEDIPVPAGAKLLSLKVKGIKIDTITQLGPRASEGNILYEWLGLGGCVINDDDEDKVPERFWRTLVGDRGSHFEDAPRWYHRAFLYCLSQSVGNVDINTSRLITEYEGKSQLVVDFLRRVQSVIWNRKFLVCKKGDWVGLAPMAAEVGDVVCVLYGCSVPVVLRQYDGFWRVVGECYVHGIMDGEAIDLTNHDSAMEFILR